MMGPSSDRRETTTSAGTVIGFGRRECRGRSPRPRIGTCQNHSLYARRRSGERAHCSPRPPYHHFTTTTLKTIMYMCICGSTCAKTMPAECPGDDMRARFDRCLRAAAPQHATTDPTARDLSYRRTRAAPEGTWRVRGVKDTRSQRLRQAQKRVRQPRTQGAAG